MNFGKLAEVADFFFLSWKIKKKWVLFFRDCFQSANRGDVVTILFVFRTFAVDINIVGTCSNFHHYFYISLLG